jgi:hypothetical protein
MRAVVPGKGASKPRLAKPPISTPTERRLKCTRGRHCRRGRPFASPHRRPRERRNAPRHSTGSVRTIEWSPRTRPRNRAPARAIVQDYEVRACRGGPRNWETVSREAQEESSSSANPPSHHMRSSPTETLRLGCGPARATSSSRLAGRLRRQQWITSFAFHAAPRDGEAGLCQTEVVVMSTGALPTSGYLRLPRARGGIGRRRARGSA